MPPAHCPRRFQFTPSHGGRRSLAVHHVAQLSFQFTPSHGGRLLFLPINTPILGFQFTPSHGGRLPKFRSYEIPLMFQFTPSHGGRRQELKWQINAEHVSIHALAWRATWKIPLSVLLFYRFNSRPRMEGDGRPHRARNTSSCFNSRPRMEGDCQRYGRRGAGISFNSRPRMEGDSTPTMRKVTS